MNQTGAPPTDDRFSPPEGLAFGEFRNFADARIRTAHIPPQGAPKGVIVLVTGFREPLEKYFEVMREKSAEGFEIRAMDWWGQGGSDRFLPDPMPSHHIGYDVQVRTLHQFVSDHAPARPGLPRVLLAHSMGAHIGLRYLKEHAGVFDAAVLTAPMLDIRTGLPRFVARLAALFMHVSGRGGAYVPGGAAWTLARDVFAGNEKTSDPVRFAAQTRAYVENPALQMGDATFGWVHQTFRSVAVLRRAAYLKSINTPILMEISGDERIVDKDAAARAAALLPDCKRVDIPAAKHEIWMERDELRGPWRREAGAFLAAVKNKKDHAP